MSSRKSNKQFKEEIFNIVGDEYTVLGEYIGANKKVKFRHNTCGYEFDTKASHFLNTGTRCPICSRKKRSHDDYIKLVQSLVGDEYTVLGEYKTSAVPVLTRHNVCGHEWEVRPINFTKSTNFTRCPACKGTLRYTTESFKEEAYKVHGEDYSVLGEYTRLDNKILVKHNECGREYNVHAGSFLKGAKCMKCKKGHGNKRKTTAEFKKEVKEKTNGEFVVLGEYVKNSAKIEMLHNVCGTIFEKTLNTMLSKGFICPNCKKHKIRDEKEFISDLANIHGEEYILSGTYTNQNTKVLITHTECGNEFEVLPTTILRGTRCPYCYGALAWSTEKLSNFIKEMYNGEYELVSEYINANEPVMIRHTICNTVNSVKVHNFLRGAKCLTCFGSSLKTTEQFIGEVKKLVKDEYTVLGEYISSGEPLLMKHEECNTEYMVRPNAFLRGSRCPRCMQSSRGEDRIIHYLEYNNIKFKSQFKIDACRNKRALPFDFAIYDNGKLIGLIEYQGKQHYKIVEHFNGEQGFKERKYNDKIKKDFCKNNDIPLLEIPFWSYDDIENIIEDFMKKIKL